MSLKWIHNEMNIFSGDKITVFHLNYISILRTLGSSNARSIRLLHAPSYGGMSYTSYSVMSPVY